MVFTGLAAAGVAGALGLGSSLLGSKEQKSENKRAFERDFFMWNAQNAYNHPSEQMARLKAAGLNPMLVYGNGSVVGNTTGSAPKYQPADVSGKYSGVGKGFDAYVAARQLHQNLQLGQEQIGQVKANKELLEEQTSKASEEKRRTKAEADILERQLKDTPPGFDPKGNHPVEKVIRAFYGIGRRSKKWADKNLRPDDPTLFYVDLNDGTLR